MKVLQFPLAKITLWFIAGILFAFYTTPATTILFSLLAIAALALCFSFCFSKKDWLQKPYFGISAYCLSFFIGATTLVVHSGYSEDSHYIHRLHHVEENHLLEVVLRERIKSTVINERYVAFVQRMDQKPVSGKILINLRKAEFNGPFRIGTRLQLSAKIRKHQKPHNPDQFDYGNYLANKSILAQVYVGVNEVKIGNTPTKDLFYYADLLRNRILNNLKKSNFQESELHVVAALVLGQQQDIAPEIVKDYQFAGAVHILSVSGLHVGFILVFLTFALRFLPKTGWTAYFKLCLIISGLWGFAILSGLSPSVIRSVTMFSFVAIGMHLNRKTNIFHTLLVSILLILLFEPSFLFDIGFQLSYLALFFILWLQPILAKIWQPKNKIADYFWQILTVSFAAQIGTLPLSLYYFHQFPGLFFLTNLIIIPFLSVIMGLGVVVMILAAFGLTPAVFVKSLEWCIVLLDKIIAGIASFSQFIIQEISFNQYMMLGLYALIVAVVVWIVKPSFPKAVFVLSTVIVFQLSCLTALWHNQNEKEWIVFNTKKSTLIGERNGRALTIYSNQKRDENQMLKAYAVANFATIIQQKAITNTAFFNGKKILIIDSLGVYPKNRKADIVILRESPKFNLERLLQTARPKTIVADASNFKSYVKLWEATCRKYDVSFYSVYESGYFKI